MGAAFDAAVELSPPTILTHPVFELTVPPAILISLTATVPVVGLVADATLGRAAAVSVTVDTVQWVRRWMSPLAELGLTTVLGGRVEAVQ